MQRLEVSGAVRHIYASLGFKGLIFALLRVVSTASLNNDIFRPLYRPSSGCTFSYFKAYYTISNFFFCQKISYTSIKPAFKISTVAVKLKIYSEIKDINSIKVWVCDPGRGGVMVSNWGYSYLATLVFCGVTANWLPGSAVIVSSWQMLRSGRSPTVVVELVSRRWLKYT